MPGKEEENPFGMEEASNCRDQFRHGGEQVRFEAVIGDVAAGHGKGVGRDVDRIDPGIGEGVSHQDRQAAGAGTQIDAVAARHDQVNLRDRDGFLAPGS